MALVKLAKVDDIPEGGMILGEHGDRQVLLAKVDGTIYAMNDVCTHAEGPLHQGDLGREGPCLVTCPYHEAHFDVRDGKVQQDTDWATDSAAYRVEIRDGEVWVDL